MGREEIVEETTVAEPDGPESGASVELIGVTKRFGDFTAVDDLDLALPRGEFFTLLGPSGCGKTTTLRMIAGFEQPTSGRIMLDGSDVARVPLLGSSKPAIIRSVVVLPEPEGPSKVKNSPRWTSRSIPATATTSP